MSPEAGPEVPPRPRATWSWWEVLAVYLLANVVAVLVLAPLVPWMRSRGLVQLAGTIVVDGVILLVFLAWLRWRHPGWRGVIRWPDRPVVEAVYGLLLGGVLTLLILNFVAPVLQWTLERAAGRPIQSPRQLPGGLTGGRALLAVVLAAVAAPIVEEFVFRGCFYRALRDRFGVAIGVVASGVVFGLVHYVPRGSAEGRVLLMAAVAVFGMGLAAIHERRGNLLANTAAHMVFNIVGLAQLLSMIR